MTKSISAKVTMDIAADLVDAIDIGSAQYPLRYSPTWTFTDGTGADQAKAVFTDTRTLSASATENLDLAGVLTGPMGDTLTFTAIKALIVRAAAANTNDVMVGGHATAAIATLFGDSTDKVRVKPGGAVMWVAPAAAGYAITATTADMLTVTNSAGSTGVTYDIIVIGTT